MTELITTQPMGIAAILAAIAFLLQSFARVVIAVNEHVGPLAKATVEAIRAWTKRTNDERDCGTRLEKLEREHASLKRLLIAAGEENGKLRALLRMAGIDVDDIPIAVTERGDEPTGDQHVPAGVTPLPNRRKR